MSSWLLLLSDGSEDLALRRSLMHLELLLSRSYLSSTLDSRSVDLMMVMMELVLELRPLPRNLIGPDHVTPLGLVPNVSPT